MGDLIRRIGQLFITGFSGEEPPHALLNILAEEQLGGVLLLDEYCPSHSQVVEIVNRIKACYRDAPAFIAVDQEGGRVSRIKGAPAQFRSPAEYAKSSDVTKFSEDYARSLVCLTSLGINLNLAPVADLRLNDENPVLEGRCFGDTPGGVALFVKAAVATARAHGMLSCLKHFPGLGAAVNDPHVDVSRADYDFHQWRGREMIPFQDGVLSGADLLMTTHLSLPKIDDTIVTGSRKIISEMVRIILAFDGPVITDDLTMEGAAVLGTIGERTVAAFKAGHDLLLFGRDYEAALRAYDYFVESYQRGEITDREIRAALDRVTGIKYKLTRSVLR